MSTDKAAEHDGQCVADRDRTHRSRTRTIGAATIGKRDAESTEAEPRRAAEMKELRCQQRNHRCHGRAQAGDDLRARRGGADEEIEPPRRAEASWFRRCGNCRLGISLRKGSPGKISRAARASLARLG